MSKSSLTGKNILDKYFLKSILGIISTTLFREGKARIGLSSKKIKLALEQKAKQNNSKFAIPVTKRMYY